MKVLLGWLREFVAIDLAPEALAAALSLHGTAVDRVDALDHGDWIFDLDLTSNRPDCLSHYGIAREIAAFTQQPLRPLPLAARAPGHGTGPKPRVSIDVPAACPRYCAMELSEISHGRSGGEIAARLEALGQRTIHPVADLTNYTLFEMGQPTHAFDADKLRGGELRVRWARAGESLVTLDGIERRLQSDDLVIADAEHAVALAGILGGLDTAVDATTRRVWLESAWFDPLTIRRSARRHGLHTEASHRFERGADPDAAPVALELIAQRAPGARRSEMADVGGQTPDKAEPVRLRAAAIERLLGRAVESSECRRMLESLGCRLLETASGTKPGADAWQIPSWRHDLTREVDLIEEIARLYGYDRFPARLPAFAGAARPLPEAALRDRCRQLLRAHGYSEAVTISFAAESECRQFEPQAAPVRVLNPLSEEAGILRTTTLPAMLQLLHNNLVHGVQAPKLFEVGKTYTLEARNSGGAGGEPVETPVLSLGAVTDVASAPGAAKMDFAVWKGEIEALLALFEHPKLEYSPAELGYLHPGRSAVCPPFARFGQIHPAVAEAWKLPAQTWVAEIALDRLYPLGPRQPHYHAPSRFPASERDFSFLLATSTTWAEVRRAIEAEPAIPHLETLEPVEIYRGPKLGEGHYSLLLRARFQSPERTLQEDEIQAAADELARRLTRLGGVQR